jgi:hypothetical protein
VDLVELAWIPLVLGPKLLTEKMEQHGMLFHAMTSAAKAEIVVCWLRLGWKPSPFKAELLVVLKREKRGSRAALCSFYIQSSKLEGVIVPCFRDLYEARNEELRRNQGLEGA